jgi:hypothetical protein
MGQGWLGLDYHWRVRHEQELPYAAFMEGLCTAHRGTMAVRKALPDPAAAAPSALPAPEPVRGCFQRLPTRWSNHAIQIIAHALIAAIAETVWQKYHWLDLRVVKEELDDTGFHIVLCCNGLMRYIQIRRTLLQGSAVKYFRHREDAPMGGCFTPVLA